VVPLLSFFDVALTLCQLADPLPFSKIGNSVFEFCHDRQEQRVDALFSEGFLDQGPILQNCISAEQIVG
jgi:hypothetical protein